MGGAEVLEELKLCPSHTEALEERQLPEEGEVDAADEGWPSIDDADVMRDPDSSVIGVADGEEVTDVSGGSVQVPIGVPEPPTPSASEV